MGLRPGRCYRKLERPYTRRSIRVPKKGYVKGVPASKITQFEAGKKDNYDKVVYMNAKRSVQVRHNSLESARIAAVQIMEKKLAKGSTFFMKIRVYPHHVLRENALATGAGADRFQTGMRQSFGKPVSTAARVHAGQCMIEIYVMDANVGIAKLALKKASYKLPTPTKLQIEKATVIS